MTAVLESEPSVSPRLVAWLCLCVCKYLKNTVGLRKATIPQLSLRNVTVCFVPGKKVLVVNILPALISNLIGKFQLLEMVLTIDI